MLRTRVEQLVRLHLNDANLLGRRSGWVVRLGWVGKSLNVIYRPKDSHDRRYCGMTLNAAGPPWTYKEICADVEQFTANCMAMREGATSRIKCGGRKYQPSINGAVPVYG